MNLPKLPQVPLAIAFAVIMLFFAGPTGFVPYLIGVVAGMLVVYIWIFADNDTIVLHGIEPWVLQEWIWQTHHAHGLVSDLDSCTERVCEDGREVLRGMGGK